MTHFSSYIARWVLGGGGSVSEANSVITYKFYYCLYEGKEEVTEQTSGPNEVNEENRF